MFCLSVLKPTLLLFLWKTNEKIANTNKTILPFVCIIKFVAIRLRNVMIWSIKFKNSLIVVWFKWHVIMNGTFVMTFLNNIYVPIMLLLTMWNCWPIRWGLIVIYGGAILGAILGAIILCKQHNSPYSLSPHLGGKGTISPSYLYQGPIFSLCWLVSFYNITSFLKWICCFT